MSVYAPYVQGQLAFAGFPAASAANSGSVLRATDVGLNGANLRSNGKLWLPDGAGKLIFGPAALPMISPPQGSMGNNGAVTFGTALPSAYPACYCYFAANTIASGVAAGWYFTAMSSTTAGTVYNNSWTPGSGQPAVPASPTAFASTGPGAFGVVTSTATIAQWTLPANLIGPQGFVEIKAEFQVVSAASVSHAFNVSFGGTTLYTNNYSSSIQQRAFWTLSNQGAGNRQRFYGIINYGSAGTGASYASVDTTAAVNITASLKPGAATNGNMSIMELFQVEVSPG